MKYWADHTYIINRTDREDRKEHAINQVKTLGFLPRDYTVVEAITPENTKIRYKPDSNKEGWNRCAAALNMSTTKVLNLAKKAGYNSIMVLEDDVLFTKDALDKAYSLWKRMDSTTYDLFHLGHQAKIGKEPRILGGGLVRLRGSYMCHAYIINSRIFDDMITILNRMDQPLDWVTADIFHPRGRCYAAEPAIATQKPDYSNIRNKNVNYNFK